MSDLVEQLLSAPGRYFGKQVTHEGATEHLGVARIEVVPLPGGGGVAMDYEVLTPEGGAVHVEHAVLARSAAGVVLVTAHSHAPVASVVPQDPDEPGWFPGPEGSAPFPYAVRIEVPEPEVIRYSWSYAAPGGELSVRDVGEVRRAG
jgi:hypothetical protein